MFISKRSSCSLRRHCRSSIGYKATRRTGITSPNMAFSYSGRWWSLNMSITSTMKLLFMVITVQARRLHLSKRMYLSWAHVSCCLHIITWRSVKWPQKSYQIQLTSSLWQSFTLSITPVVDCRNSCNVIQKISPGMDGQQPVLVMSMECIVKNALLGTSSDASHVEQHMGKVGQERRRKGHTLQPRTIFSGKSGNTGGFPVSLL